MAISLNNFTITGFGAGGAANVSLSVNPLVLAGNLVITNATSSLVTNDLGVTIGGDFTNSGTYTYGNNTTVFNGNAQSILGTTVTNFNNMTVSPVTSLSVNNNFTVNGNLSITRGTLILGSRRLTLLKNITNDATYTDDNVNGGVYLNGSILQQIYGTGSFGRLVLNNALGARTNNDLTIQNNLELTLGLLDISSNRLTLGVNSQIGGAPFSATKMIVSDGVISSGGLRKFFNTIAVRDTFYFPVGVSEKYTPATYFINANGSVGYINVSPVNSNHPGVLDEANVLNYYWAIESSGISGFNGSLLLGYDAGDVSGTESDYIAARLLSPGTFWSKATPGPSTDNVNEVTHEILFQFPAGSDNLSGDFTAGIDSAIPDEVPSYITVSDGDWSDRNIWAPVGSAPACPVGGPNGFIVIIDHEVRTDIGYCFAYRTTINNTLTIPATTFGHNLGLVDGSGTLVLNGGNLPAGNFSSFLNCPSGGTLEYSGTGNYTIIATQFNTVPALFLSGTGFRYLPNRDLTICRRLVIDGPTLDNTLNNKSLIIGGTLERYNSGTFLSGSGLGATVSFQGTTVQHLGGALGSFDGVNGFNNLEINNTHGLVLGNGNIEVNGNLLLTEGIISTSATDRLIINNQSSTCVIPSGGKSTSFINGPLTKSIPSAASFVFPLGTGTTFGHALTVTAGTGTTTQWTANYVRPNSTSGSFNSPLQAVNADEYWAISSSVARNATVKLGWDIYSAITPLMTQNGISDIRLTDLAAGTWQELSSVTSGDGNNGTVASSGSVSITPTERDFTIAAVTTLKPRASLNPSGPVCGNAGIPVSFTSSSPITLNYTLSYSINGIAQTPVVVSSLPYTLPTSSSGAYRLTGFTYNNGSGTGVVDPRPINVYDIPTTANAGPDQSLCGLSSTTLAANAPAPYSGLWTIVSGTGGTLTNATLYNTTFSGVLGGSYTLRWTISNSSCTSFDEVTISFPVVASRPGNFTASVTPVCQNTTGHIFTVPNVAGQTYNWSYTGTGHTINGTGNSVTIDFGPTATSGTLSVTATNSCGTSVPRTMDITVTPTPVAAFSYAGSPYCPNAANALPTFSGGGVAGSFSSTAGLVFANTSTGEVNISASTPGTYTVTYTVAAAGGCSVVSATNTLIISSVFNWTGAVSTDWNNAGNWSCGIIPTLLTDVIIPNVSNKPVISSGLAGGIRNLTIAAGSSLTISGNTLRIAGTISNSGTITAIAGTIEMNGTSPQSIGSGVFSGGLVQNLIINNASGVTLGGPVGVTGYLRVVSGDLASAGNLTLVSTASGTAYIDGTGSGQVTGSVNMERYLPSTFGYRYISSPFQAATISQLSDEINLAASFPPVYRYDESRTTSGWVSYVNPVNVMNPLQGFSVNFGNVSAAGTFDITGVVNNGPLSVTLYNHDNTYTRGLNLIGNPYPSPIDWDAASGWTKTNIDDALYYFKPGATDQYVGTYSSYINGISSDGIVSNIIPSMQAVFIHVSDGAFPVTGILSLNNQVRSGNTSQSFSKSGEKGNRQMVRLSAVFESDTSKTDKMLIYLDEKGTAHFEKTLDALKLMNTDLSVPNIYSLSLENSKLSISAISESSDDLVQIPLGVKANKDGTLRVKISEINDFYPGYNIYFYDNVTGISRSLLYNGSYSVFLPKGEYMTRFFLNISRLTTGTGSDQVAGKEFSVWLSEGVLKADIRQLKGGKGEIFVSNMAGQILYTRRIDETGYQEFDMSLTNGIYMVTLVTGNQKITRKLIVNR
ncbi:MAG: T9SS type A sorting domain-containing protein [Bacteroidales bacterium]